MPEAAATPRELWRRAQWGWPVAFPLVQFPNAPLIVALVAGWVADLVAAGDPQDVLRALSRVALAVWAGEELLRGVNPFRRVLGAVALAYLVVVLAG